MRIGRAALSELRICVRGSEGSVRESEHGEIGNGVTDRERHLRRAVLVCVAIEFLDECAQPAAFVNVGEREVRLGGCCDRPNALRATVAFEYASDRGFVE